MHSLHMCTRTCTLHTCTVRTCTLHTCTHRTITYVVFVRLGQGADTRSAFSRSARCCSRSLRRRMIVVLSIDGVSDDGEAAVHVEVRFVLFFLSSCGSRSNDETYELCTVSHHVLAVLYNDRQTHLPCSLACACWRCVAPCCVTSDS
jgi:hypothetical protein